MAKGAGGVERTARVQSMCEEDILAKLLTTERRRKGIVEARKLIEKFGSVAAVLSISPKMLTETTLDPIAVQTLAALQNLFVEGVHIELKSRPLVENRRALLAYLQWTQGRSTTEQLRILFFDAKSRLIEDQIHAKGTAQRVLADPIVIIRDGIQIGAAGIILAHNHPSGCPKPSDEDILMTRRIMNAAIAVGISFFDHIIVAHGRWFSFRESALLDVA